MSSYDPWEIQEKIEAGNREAEPRQPAGVLRVGNCSPADLSPMIVKAKALLEIMMDGNQFPPICLGDHLKGISKSANFHSGEIIFWQMVDGKPTLVINSDQGNDTGRMFAALEKAFVATPDAAAIPAGWMVYILSRSKKAIAERDFLLQYKKQLQEHGSKTSTLFEQNLAGVIRSASAEK